MQIFKNFVKSPSGNVAIMFALSAVPLMLAGGMAIDYMSGSHSQTALQKAVDNAALAAGASGEDSEKKLKNLVRKYLLENGAADVLDQLTKIEVITSKDKELKVIAKGKIKTRFLGLVGYKKLKIEATAIVNRDFGNLELVLVLDNTGSMNANGKLDSLKDSANILVRELHDNKGSSAELKIGIVPFSKYVNVGLGNRNKPWIDVPADSSKVISGTRDIRQRVAGSERNCGTRTSTSTNDGVTSTSTYYACDYDYEVVGTEDYSYTVTTTWNGCVGSRDYPLNVEDKLPNSRIPGLMNVSCARPVTRLTDSKSEIINEIDALTATGDTYIPAGLMWGWRLMSSDAPFEDGVSYNKMSKKNYTKAIVLMTDGINTLKPNYPTHSTSDASIANGLTAELCNNIKNSGSNEQEHIAIYAVTFEVTDSAVKDLLRSCATNSSYYFDASDKYALTEAFRDIAQSLITLRLAK